MVLPAIASAARVGARAAGKGAKSAARKNSRSTAGRKGNDGARRSRRVADRNHPSTTEVGNRPTTETQEYAKEYTRQKKDQVQARHRDKKQIERAKQNNSHLKNKKLSKLKTGKFRGPKMLENELTEMASEAILKARSVELSINIGYVIIHLWLMVQIPLWFLCITSFFSSVFFGAPGDIKMGLAEGSAGLVGKLTVLIYGSIPGISQMTEAFVYALDVGSGIFMGLAIGANGLITILGWALLMIAAIIYSLNGINWWGGKMSALKKGLFIFALVGYAMAFLNFLPYIIPWMIAVAFNPE